MHQEKMLLLKEFRAVARALERNFEKMDRIEHENLSVTEEAFLIHENREMQARIQDLCRRISECKTWKEILTESSNRY